VLRSGAGESLAAELGAPFLGRVPLHPSVAAGSDAGKPFMVSAPESEAALAFEAVVDGLVASIRAAD
jgi:ATP-binding protein involved in chromosome partitioning